MSSVSCTMRGSIAAAICIALVACTETPIAPDGHSFPQAGITPVAVDSIRGEIGPGALYGLYVPQHWNGDLVLWAHGYTMPASPLLLPVDWQNGCAFGPQPFGFCPVQLRDSLLNLGYAFALSSFSENGLTVPDGAVRTAQVGDLFAAKYGKPNHVYLMSHSMGGAVIMRMLEQHPKQYTGGMPVCGVIGGMPYQLSYYFNVRVLFNYYYPGILPNDLLPAAMNPSAVVGAILANPAGAYNIANIAQTKIVSTGIGDVINGIVSALMFQTADWFGGEVWRTTHGRLFFDNVSTLYTGSSDDVALNAGVARYQAAPDAANLVAHWYDPSGKLKVPVLSFNMKYDPVVPVAHQSVYAALADAQGASDMFLARTADSHGHCTASAAQELTAFRDLVQWARTGVKPAN